jgi:hypothetical protein
MYLFSRINHLCIRSEQITIPINEFNKNSQTIQPMILNNHGINMKKSEQKENIQEEIDYIDLN